MEREIRVQKLNQCESMAGMPNYFDLYPSPMLKAMWEQHVTPMSSITTYYGPFFYWLCRIIGATRGMEIGIDMGWSTFFMASACKDEAARRGGAYSFYGCDPADRNNIVEKTAERDVKINLLQKDSLDLVPSDWDNQMLHVVFQDGYHSTEYVMDELEILYPYLADKGNGYWIMHDVYSHCEEVFPKVIEKYEFEYIRFFSNYGIAILRNMKNYDYNHVHWPQGPERPAYPLGNKLHTEKEIS